MDGTLQHRNRIINDFFISIISENCKCRSKITNKKNALSHIVVLSRFWRLVSRGEIVTFNFRPLQLPYYDVYSPQPDF